MADIWLDVDTALTAVPINKVPIVDVDGLTVDTAMVYNEAGLSLEWNFMTSAGVFTHTAVTPTDTAGVYDFVNQGEGMYTIEIPASGGGTINNDTEGYGWFSGNCTANLPWVSPTYGFRAAAINDALCDGGDLLDVSLTQVNGAAQTATLDTIKAETVLIVADTGELQTDWVDGGRLDLIQDIIAADVINIDGYNPATQIGTAGAGLTNVGGSGNDWNTVVPDAAGTAPTAAEIETEIWDGLQSAHLVAGSMGILASEIAALQADLDIVTAADGVVISAQAVTDIWAKVCESEGSRTAQQILSIVLSAVAGVTTAAGATLKTPEPAGATRITATINGSNERTAITLSPSA